MYLHRILFRIVISDSRKDKGINKAQNRDSKYTLSLFVAPSGKTNLLPKSFVELNKLLILLKENDKVIIQINGHTDNTGNKESNIQLSKNRAKAVVNYFTVKGISAERLKYKGYGSSKPKADNSTTKGRAENRRVEFVIISK